MGEGFFPLGWGTKFQGPKFQFFFLSIAHWLNALLRPQANGYKNFNKFTNDKEEILKMLFL